MIVMGAGTNHWFHSDQIYRAMLALVLLCGCQGVNGGGWAHYVGQEKVRPITGWATVAFAPRLDAPAAPAGGDAVLVPGLRPVALRELRRRGVRLAGRQRLARRAPHSPTATRSPRGSAGCRPTRASTATRSTSPTRRASAGVEPAEYVVSRAARGAAALRRRGPRRPGELPARAHALAREPARLLEQGPRVLPAPPARRPRRRGPQRGVAARAAAPSEVEWRERGAGRASSTCSRRSTSA